MNMKNRTLYCFLGLFALGVSCTSVSSEEDMYALALKKNPALRHVLELYEGDSLKQQAALFLISNLACHEGVASGDMGAVYKAYELLVRANSPISKLWILRPRSVGFPVRGI